MMGNILIVKTEKFENHTDFSSKKLLVCGVVWRRNVPSWLMWSSAGGDLGRLWNLEKVQFCWRKYITGHEQALRGPSLALHPILLLCFLGMARNVISVLLLCPCFPFLLSCLPLYNGLYFPAIISQAKTLSLRLALSIAFYHSNRK